MRTDEDFKAAPAPPPFPELDFNKAQAAALKDFHDLATRVAHDRARIERLLFFLDKWKLTKAFEIWETGILNQYFHQTQPGGSQAAA